MGLKACPLESLLIVVYLTLRLSGMASTSISHCSTKHQSTEEKKKMFQPQRGKKSEIKTKKRKTYKSYLGFHSKQILYPTYKILPKNLAMAQTLNHQGTEKFMVDFLPICGATGSCCDKTHRV